MFPVIVRRYDAIVQKVVAAMVITVWRENRESEWREREEEERRSVKLTERWEANLAATRAYVEQNGGRHPRSNSACAEERKLGAWRETQRKRRRGQGTCAALSAAQVQQLEQVPGWSWAGWGRAELDAPRGLPPALGISALHPGATQMIEPREVD